MLGLNHDGLFDAPGVRADEAPRGRAAAASTQLFRPVGAQGTPHVEHTPFPANPDRPGGLSIEASGPSFARGFSPAEAHLRLGPLAVRFPAVSGAVLYSDNVHFTADPRQSGWLGIVTMQVAAQLEPVSGLRVAAGGVFGYLPSNNRFGFGLGSNPLAQFEDMTLGRIQVTYDWRPMGWEVLLYNDASVRLGALGLQVRQMEPAEDRAGRYVFRVTQGVFEGVDTRNDRPFTVGENTTGVTASRVLPPEARLTVGASHSEFWYMNVNPLMRLPTRRDEVHARLELERGTARFRPYLDYRAFRWSGSQAGIDQPWTHRAAAGTWGELSRNVRMQAEVGRFWADDVRARSSWLARAEVRHDLNRDTWHAATYGRMLTEPVRELREIVQYSLGKRLNSNWTAGVFGWRATYENLDGLQGDSREWRGGAWAGAQVRSDTSVRLDGLYSRIRFLDDNESMDRWVGRLRVDRHLWTYDLVFQHQGRSGSTRSFRENVVAVTVTRRL